MFLYIYIFIHIILLSLIKLGKMRKYTKKYKKPYCQICGIGTISEKSTDLFKTILKNIKTDTLESSKICNSCKILKTKWENLLDYNAYEKLVELAQQNTNANPEWLNIFRKQYEQNSLED